MKDLCKKADDSYNAANRLFDKVCRDNEISLCDSAVSRAYYSVFQIAYTCAYEIEGYTDEQATNVGRKGMHEKIIEHLKQTGYYHSVIGQLRTLKRERERADYYPDDFSAIEVSELIKKAGNCRNRIYEILKERKKTNGQYN